MVVAGAAWLFAGCRHVVESETRPPGENILDQVALRDAMESPVDFRSHVAPVLQVKCLYCHNGKVMAGRYRMDNRKQAFAPGAEGPRIVPGQPDASPFVRVLTGAHALTMPAVGNQVTQDEIRLLEKWIREGANWPEDVTLSPQG
jgi:hypothetical protein